MEKCWTLRNKEVRKRECNAGDPGSILRSGRIPVGGNGNPLQYSCLENTTDQSLAGYSPWGCIESMGLHRHDWVTDTFTCQKRMNTEINTHYHSLVRSLQIRRRRKWQPTPVFLPGDSQGWGSLVGHRLWGRTVGHDWSDLAAAATASD